MFHPTVVSHALIDFDYRDFSGFQELKVTLSLLSYSDYPHNVNSFPESVLSLVRDTFDLRSICVIFHLFPLVFYRIYGSDIRNREHGDVRLSSTASHQQTLESLVDPKVLKNNVNNASDPKIRDNSMV